MKYLILRARLDASENPFTEMVAAGGGGPDFEFPFRFETQELSDQDVGDRRRDPNVEELIPSIPFTLVAPVEESSTGSAAQKAWGVDAVGATMCPQRGDGVTVAVLDTGIDTAHPAF